MIFAQDIKVDFPEITIIGSETHSFNEVVAFDENNQSMNVLSWVGDKLKDRIHLYKKGVLIIPSSYEGEYNKDVTYLITDNPRQLFANILQKYFLEKNPEGVAESASIHPESKIGISVFIGENVVIEKNCKVGDNCMIGHNTVLKSGTILHNNVQIGSNCTIGGVGFGYEKNENGTYQVIPHIGNVVISDNCEIGNNTCIDRAVLGSTFLSPDVKVDNLVHIAHGVKIGRNSLIIANSMIAGSTVIGENVWVAPSVSVINKGSVEDNALIGMGAVVVKPVLKNQVIVGNPGKPLEK